MAHKLHCPLQELQKKTTSREFLEWQCYLNEFEPNEFHREDYYHAQTAQAVHQTMVKKPSSVLLDRFILSFKFGRGKDGTKEIDTAGMDRDKRTAASKGFWGAITGRKIK